MFDNFGWSASHGYNSYLDFSEMCWHMGGFWLPSKRLIWWTRESHVADGWRNSSCTYMSTRNSIQWQSIGTSYVYTSAYMQTCMCAYGSMVLNYTSKGSISKSPYFRQWKFRPIIYNSQLVACIVTISVSHLLPFSLVVIFLCWNMQIAKVPPLATVWG